MTEIGRVRLNYKHYSGRDLYSDGEIEEQILAIVQNNSTADFHRIIGEQKSWPILYHLSHLRENTIEWLPLTKTSKVLEIGAGCGAVTGKLAEKAGSVVCVDLSDRRSRINAWRHQDYDNITIHVGNFKDIEPELPTDFDFILMIGVFEYSCLYMDTPTPYEDMLRIMKKHLGAAGRLVIAIENRLGLKYWAGCREDHEGTFFSGIEGYPEGGNARTFTRKGLEKLLAAGDIGEYTFYYPYPDYKFMTTLYSDARLPVKGELIDNTRNFDRDRLVLFREKYAFDNIIGDGLFPDFSNSYLVVTGKSPETAYVRYSNDRAREYCVRTEIMKRAEGGLQVRKTPLFPEAAAHVRQMEETYHVLCKKYQGSGLAINRCTGDEDGLSANFEYVNGETLSERLDRCLAEGDREAFRQLFERFFHYIMLGAAEETAGRADSVREDSSREADGRPKVLSNYDFIFSNIIINQEQPEQWTLIDYEWVFEEVIPPTAIAFRALYCYYLEEESRKVLNPDLIMARIGITPEMAEEYQKNENKFQRLVNGQWLSIGEIRNGIGTRRVALEKILKGIEDPPTGRRVQIYYDWGAGFSEAESLCPASAYRSENEVRVELVVGGGLRALRLDPADRPCAVKIKQLLWNGVKIPLHKKLIETNGKRMRAGDYIFTTGDPNITLYVSRLESHGESRAENRLEAELTVALMPTDLAVGIADSAR